MPICPECGSSDVSEGVYSPEEKYDGLGNCVVEHYYECNNCGCQWTEREKIIHETEIDKHGKFFLDNEFCGRHLGADELVEKLKEAGYKADYVTVASNRIGYFAIVRAEQEGEVSYLGVESFTGEPICVGTIELGEGIKYPKK